ncbi:hypothetical protein AXI64_gp010 [Vibrio phage qdvp001]|uniref:hypothetical protein n=1 Tax=Vibrio phage qdvp001 TaxID=1003177 RepID=UPI00071F1EFD|nr:hypothetical protein AXI64_gp010 [Vibrio phage qdvp001]ALM62002.1 hypothetical protein qdvp001_010 [Vibrio phage qdvp001]
MNKKFRKQFHRNFPWYDYAFLLEAMLLWSEKASERHKKHGHLLRSNSTSRKLKLVSELLKRLIADDYDEPCKIFNSRNKTLPKGNNFGINLDEDFTYLKSEYSNYLRNQDKKMLFNLLNKHLFEFWD